MKESLYDLGLPMLFCPLLSNTTLITTLYTSVTSTIHGWIVHIWIVIISVLESNMISGDNWHYSLCDINLFAKALRLWLLQVKVTKPSKEKKHYSGIYGRLLALAAHALAEVFEYKQWCLFCSLSLTNFPFLYSFSFLVFHVLLKEMLWHIGAK